MLKRIDHFLHVFLVIRQGILSEALEEIQQKIEAIMINLLQIGLQLTYIAFFQLLLHKFYLIQPFACQFTQTVKDAIAT